MPAHKFNRAYPFFDKDRQRVISDYDLSDDDRANLEATALLFAEYAGELDAIAMKTRRAETENTGSVAKP